MNRDTIKDLGLCRRAVIKIGTSLISNAQAKDGIDQAMLEKLCSEILFLRENGIQVMLVTSGAVQTGKHLLKQHRIPVEISVRETGRAGGASEDETALQLRQAMSAFGQNTLLSAYQRTLASANLPTAQLLLTASDFRSRRTYLNISHTITKVLQLQGVAIVNENDTVATDELQFGENDLLSAACAAVFHADSLFILTSVEGFLSKGNRISCIENILPEHWKAAKGAETVGRGGMQTKLRAAQLCSLSEIHCAILPGNHKNPIQAFFKKEDIGTFLPAKRRKKLNARKKWLLFSRCRGTLIIDAGARLALEKQGASLLPVGIRSLRGRFFSHEIVEMEDESGLTIGRGLINYSHSEVLSMLGLSAHEMQEKNIMHREPEVIHRNNLVLESQTFGTERNSQND